MYMVKKSMRAFQVLFKVSVDWLLSSLPMILLHIDSELFMIFAVQNIT